MLQLSLLVCLCMLVLLPHCWEFSFSFSFCLLSALQPILTSLWFLEQTETGVKLLRTRSRQICTVRYFYLFWCTYNRVLWGKYVFKDLLTSLLRIDDFFTGKKKKKMLKSFQQFNYQIKNCSLILARIYFSSNGKDFQAENEFSSLCAI